MFAMTSFGAKIDDSVNKGRGPYVFKISGQIYHWIGSLCPEVLLRADTEASRWQRQRKKSDDERLLQISVTFTGKGIRPYLQRGDREGIAAGLKIMLPDTFTGGPRYMYNHYLDALYPELTPTDRAYIVCRVFEQKVKDFIKFLKEVRTYGYVCAEFQKRGLLHYHTLLWVDSKGELQDAQYIDEFIYAEIPDPAEDPRGYKLVTYLMMHEPCGNANLGPDHILAKISNSEASTSVLGNSKQIDEIQNYVDENMQRCNFCERDRLDVIVNLPKKKKTTLTEWFVYNNENTDGRYLTYLEFPSEFVWYPNSKQWKQRQIRTKKSLGRLIYIHPSSGDLFYFRMLLCHKKRCKSPIKVRIVNGQIEPTNRAACEALGLLGDDKEWDITLQESTTSATSNEIIILFT
ncbi:DNA helicase [Tanacetum coccineum]